MEQNLSWEENRSSAGQNTLRILWNQKVHYLIQKILPLVPVMSQINPVRAYTTYLLKI